MGGVLQWQVPGTFVHAFCRTGNDEQAACRREAGRGHTNSSKGASGMRRLPLTPPLFLMAVRMSSLDSSLQAQSIFDDAETSKPHAHLHVPDSSCIFIFTCQARRH